MVITMEASLILILLSVAGAIFAGLLGWSESGEPFDTRKFINTLARSVVSGMLASLIFQDITNPTIWIYMGAILTGMGVDYGGNIAMKKVSS